MLCYQNFEINVGNNGYFTKKIKIERGNKQGCLHSALQLLLVIETVGLKLRQNPNIEAIEIE